MKFLRVFLLKISGVFLDLGSSERGWRKKNNILLEIFSY